MANARPGSLQTGLMGLLEDPKTFKTYTLSCTFSHERQNKANDYGYFSLPLET